jgi:hypothetical protein
MFAYSDAHPDRPTFERLLDAYFALLPAYQGLGSEGLEALRFKRVLFGGFPCYADSPLKPGACVCYLHLWLLGCVKMSVVMGAWVGQGLWCMHLHAVLTHLKIGRRVGGVTYSTTLP